jgi:PAS domain S-box-containing protein
MTDGSVPARILMVDDKPDNLLALEVILEPLGLTLVRAESGLAALRRLLSDDYAVILLDVQLPGLSGFETAEIIKSRERTRYTPIIFLTALSKDQEFVFRGYSVGAVDYMSKPLQPEILRSKVAAFVDLYNKNRQLARQQEQLREAERRELEGRHSVELQRTEARITEIVRAVQEAIITFDGELRITLFNSGAEKIFSTPADRWLGRTVTDLLHPESRDDFKTQVKLLDRGDNGHTVEWAGTSDQDLLVGLRGTGEDFPLEASLSRIEALEKVVYTVIGRDVSERRQSELALRSRTIELANATAELEALNQELNRRTIELEKALSARSRFYASMSHELRTPINAILGYSSLLLDNVYGPLNDQQLNGVQRTHRAAKHLLELVNDVLDLSKIEAGKIELQLEPVSFPSLLEDLFVTVRPMADEQGTPIDLEHTGAPVTIVSDPRRVRQILLNLLSNAIKFGRGKPIRVLSTATDERGVVIEVIDAGVGIHEEDQGKIFDEFVQLARSDRQEGTGLGLPISQRLAIILSGSLTVQSVPDVGSTFKLTLPRLADPVAAIEEEDRNEQRSEEAAEAPDEQRAESAA